jgi:ribosomal protein S12 methylthiotransferase
MTLGCPKNTVDSDGVWRLLEQQGHTAVERPGRADLILVNTCGFIEAARDESIGELCALAERKKRGQRLAAIGCLAERWGIRLVHEVPGLDGVLGTRRWMEVGAFALRLFDSPTPVAMIGDPARSEPTLAPTATPRGDDQPIPRRAGGASAYLKIADGCSAPCAFCAIPAIKGPAKSRPADAIVAEARGLVSGGVGELILIAQDTTAYGRDLGQTDALPALLRRLSSDVPDLHWLRLMYAYPQHITPQLIEAIATLPAVAHYLDMPVQHGHPEVLRRMHRSPDVDGVERLIESLRVAVPDIALRTSLIVGYPGETDAEFEALLQFMSRVRFDRVGVFAFSPEEGTPAAALPNRTPPAVVEDRRRRAMTHQQSISLSRNRDQVGRTLDVLIEGADQGLCVGRSYRDAPEIDGLVLAPGALLPGAWARVRIEAAMEYDLYGSTERPRGVERRGRRPVASAPRNDA